MSRDVQSISVFKDSAENGELSINDYHHMSGSGSSKDNQLEEIENDDIYVLDEGYATQIRAVETINS